MNMNTIKRVALSVGLMGSLLCGAMGQAQANVIYTNVYTFAANTVLKGSSTINWSHAITSEFQVPFDTVNSASLVIHSQRAVGENDEVFVVDLGQMISNLGALGASGNSDYTSTLTIPNGIFTAGWTSGKALQLSLKYNQGTSNNDGLTMLSSTLKLDFNNETGPLPSNAVPEPAPVALMGLALAGLLVAKRRKQ